MVKVKVKIKIKIKVMVMVLGTQIRFPENLVKSDKHVLHNELFSQRSRSRSCLWFLAFR